MHAWEKIRALVDAQSGETTIDDALKNELRLLGESLTGPCYDGHYVVFSQFPIGTGKVDFAVFTGPSRMTVTLIEIKGADFNFETSGGTADSHINTGYIQILERYDFAKQSFAQFKHDMHLALDTAIDGTYSGTFLVGPNGTNLEVDRHKEIHLRGLVIGGRTRDDRSESRLRHMLEQSNSSIRFESWHSWFRRQGPVSAEIRYIEVSQE